MGGNLNRYLKMVKQALFIQGFFQPRLCEEEGVGAGDNPLDRWQELQRRRPLHDKV